ncbi:glycosyltransferase family 2 protein [Methylotuvimicrobium sp.]|uniref:glycosyltransferase family 2 protein n=1 Tax=Methylotuvimicrobium sp. TaxID=2822413 RepID=UPI003D648222
MSNQTQIDICLCTFMRPELLRETLTSIEQQQLSPDINVKVFVVDNDANAGAETVINEFKMRGLIDITYDIEPEQNIALARNRSVRMGKGDYVAFIDDDEVASESWLTHLYDCLRRYEADGVFGPVVPIYPSNAPAWVVESGLIDRPSHKTGTTVVTGATNNTLVKRSLLDQYTGPFDREFGLTGGSDAALFRKAVKDGFKLIWCNEAIVSESVPDERMTFEFLKRRSYRGGQCYARIILAEATLIEKLMWFFKRLAYTTVAILLVPFAMILGTKYTMRAIRKLFLNLGQLSVLSGRYYYEYRR